jgi:hypothetical protein
MGIPSTPGSAMLDLPRRRWQSGGVLLLEPVPDDPRPWDQIPGVGLVGIVIGLVIVVAAIRYMVKKK